ncbi:MAG: sugar phosphate isomerase/epimerase family protein [Armatimonadota bacterium]
MSAERVTRRDVLKSSAALVLAAAEGGSRPYSAVDGRRRRGMKLGLVTYNMAKDWDVPTIIARCKATGFEGVELRTTHAHGVEPSMSQTRREEVRQMFADSGVVLWGLGTVCEFHAPDPAVVRQNVEVCKSFVVLAKDVGAKGVKVRPNALPEGVPVERTLEQIGKALTECGRFAADYGVEIWLEVHGSGTSHPPHIRTIMDHCSHPQVGVCWNSNPTDIKDGSVREYFRLLEKDIKSCHITELCDPRYPWRELFSLLRQAGYDRFTLAEIPGSSDPERVMRYYKALWDELRR